MARFQHKRLDQPDEVRPYPLGSAEVFEMDDFVIGRMVHGAGLAMEQGRAARSPAPSAACTTTSATACPGRLQIELEDGTTGIRQQRRDVRDPAGP